MKALLVWCVFFSILFFIGFSNAYVTVNLWRGSNLNATEWKWKKIAQWIFTQQKKIRIQPHLTADCILGFQQKMPGFFIFSRFGFFMLKRCFLFHSFNESQIKMCVSSVNSNQFFSSLLYEFVLFFLRNNANHS